MPLSSGIPKVAALRQPNAEVNLSAEVLTAQPLFFSKYLCCLHTAIQGTTCPRRSLPSLMGQVGTSFFHTNLHSLAPCDIKAQCPMPQDAYCPEFRWEGPTLAFTILPGATRSYLI